MIGSGQLLLLLIVSHCFNLLNYIPAFNQPAEYPAVLWGNLLGVLIQSLILLPPLLLHRRCPTESVVLVAANRWRPLGWAFGICYLAAIVVQLAGTLTGFEYFMASTIYPNTPAVFLILTLALASLWCARHGIEGIARAGAIVFVFLVLSMGFILALSLRTWDFRNLHPMLEDPLPAVWKGALQSISHFPELYLLILLYPRTRGNLAKCSYGLVAGGFLLFEVAGLLLAGVLGEYAMTRAFPFYTLAAVVDTQLIQRLDSLYMLNWVFSAFIRCTLLIIAGQECARDFLPAKAHPLLLPILTVISCILALAGSSHIARVGELSRGNSYGILTAALCAGLPLLLLIFTRPKRDKGESIQ